MPDRPRHIANLTGVRAIAALWVMIFHFQDSAVAENLELGPVADFGYLGVDVFFVLSGFILAWNYGATGRTLLRENFLRGFVVKRFARIYPLHLATFLLSILFWGTARTANYSFVTDTEYSLWSGLVNVVNLHAWGLTDSLSWNGPSWSISAEWFAYIVLFPLILLVLHHRRLSYSLLATVVTWAALMGYLGAYENWDLNQLTTIGILRIVPEFLAGYALYRVIQAVDMPMKSDMWLVTGLLTMAVVVVGRPSAVVLVLPAILLIILGLHSGGPVTDWIFGSRVMTALGEISYSMYMVHTFVQLVGNQVLRRLTTDHPAAGLVAISALIGVTIVAAFVTHRLLEVPARRWIVGRFS